MRIYEIKADFDNFDICLLNHEACRKKYDLTHLTGTQLYFNFDGSSRSENWWPRIMERDGANLKLGDYISSLSSDALILERKAIDKLNGLMGNIEILPLECDFGDYLVINIMDVLECIDYEKSEFELLSDKIVDGRPRISHFKHYEFIKDKIDGYNVFKIIDIRKSGIFVNDIFVDSVEKQGITGFKFELVWPIESAPMNHGKKQSNLATPKRGKLKVTVKQVEDGLMNELLCAKEKAYALIGVLENDNPAKVVKCIFEYVEKLLSAGTMQSGDYKAEDIAISLAAAWGHSVCEEYNWEWKELEVEGKVRKGYYILSPDHMFCCSPLYLFSKILRGENIGPDGNNDNTVELLFNMIKTLDEMHAVEKYTEIA